MKTAPPLHGMMPRSPMMRAPFGRGCSITVPRPRKRPCSAATQALPGGPASSVALVIGVAVDTGVAAGALAAACRTPHSRVCPDGHRRQQETCLGRSALRPQRKVQPGSCLCPHCMVWDSGQRWQQVWNSGPLASLPHCISHDWGLGRPGASGSSSERASWSNCAVAMAGGEAVQKGQRGPPPACSLSRRDPSGLASRTMLHVWNLRRR